MLEKEPEKQQGIGCLTLGGIVFFIFLCIETLFMATHPPIDFLSLSIYTAAFVFYLFFASPWGRPLLQKVPFLANGPLLILMCFYFYLLFKRYSFDTPQALFGYFAGLVCILYLSPWAKYMLRWAPFVLPLLLLISGGTLAISSFVSQPQIDYQKLFTVLLGLLCMLAFVLFPQFFRRKGMREDKTKDINLRIGQAEFPVEETEPATKRVVNFPVPGITLQISRAGKCWKVRLSND